MIAAHARLHADRAHDRARAARAASSAVLFGSLGLAARSSDRGEAKVEATSGMRLAQAFLRTQLDGAASAAHAQDGRVPAALRRRARRASLRGAAARARRPAAASGTTGSRCRRSTTQRSPLVLERMMPDLNALAMPTFDDAERTVLADDIKPN